ncbi:hypothetical protein KBD20_04020, partial [Candidatus Saccharibacteria bacterium]|nr:hypothetical protein [Candidatus Saccharibacteria bacterium]
KRVCGTRSRNLYVLGKRHIHHPLEATPRRVTSRTHWYVPRQPGFSQSVLPFLTSRQWRYRGFPQLEQRVLLPFWVAFLAWFSVLPGFAKWILPTRWMDRW